MVPSFKLSHPERMTKNQHFFQVYVCDLPNHQHDQPEAHCIFNMVSGDEISPLPVQK
jgi:hypothetical protein